MTDEAASSSGNDYVVPADRQLRTPAEVTSCPAFAGDSLTINGNLALKSGHGSWIEAKKWTLGAGVLALAPLGGRGATALPRTPHGRAVSP